MSIGEAFGATGVLAVVPGVLLTIVGLLGISERESWGNTVARVWFSLDGIAFALFFAAIWSQVR